MSDKPTPIERRHLRWRWASGLSAWLMSGLVVLIPIPIDDFGDRVGLAVTILFLSGVAIFSSMSYEGIMVQKGWTTPFDQPTFDRSVHQTRIKLAAHLAEEEVE